MFRDDHEAALARANALEDQVERLSDERARLEADNARLAAERDAARAGRAAPPRDDAAEVSPARPASRRTPWVVGGALALVLGVAIVLAARVGDERRGRGRTYNAAVAAREATEARWRASQRVEPCVRKVAYDEALLRRQLPARWTEADGYQLEQPLRQLIANCLDGARTLAGDAVIPAPTRAALDGWLAAEAALIAPVEALASYLGGGDWKEDGFAATSPLLAAVTGALARRADALRVVRATALPALREVLRGFQRALGPTPTEDPTWWRLKLGLELWAINEISLAASGVTAGGPIDEAAGRRALRQPIAAYLAHLAQAPLELRREARRLDWLLLPLASDAPLPADALWHLAQPEADPMRPLAQAAAPGLPPLPSPPPPDDD